MSIFEKHGAFKILISFLTDLQIPISYDGSSFAVHLWSFRMFDDGALLDICAFVAKTGHKKVVTQIRRRKTRPMILVYNVFTKYKIFYKTNDRNKQTQTPHKLQQSKAKYTSGLT